MDARFLIALIALLLVAGWVLHRRYRQGPGSASVSKGNGQSTRRASDRTFSGRQLNRAYAIDADVPEQLSNERLLPREPVRARRAVTRLQAVTSSSELADTEAETLVLEPGRVVSKPLRAAMVSSEARMAEIKRLKELLKQRDRKLTRNRHAMEEVDKLKRKLHDKGREMEMLQQACARSDAALMHYRDKGQQAALFEQQLVAEKEKRRYRDRQIRQLQEEKAALILAAQGQIETPESQSADVGGDSQRMLVKDRSSEERKEHLSIALREAEIEAEMARQNVLELRRIRGELESVRSDRENASERIDEIESRMHEQQQVLASERAAPDTDSASGNASKDPRAGNGETGRPALRLAAGRDTTKGAAGNKADVSDHAKSTKGRDDRQSGDRNTPATGG